MILHAVIDGINVHAFNGFDDAAVIDIVGAGFIENIGDTHGDDALLVIEVFFHVGVIPIFHPGDEEPHNNKMARTWKIMVRIKKDLKPIILLLFLQQITNAAYGNNSFFTDLAP